MEAKLREVWPGIFLVHLPLPMRPTIVNVYLLHSAGEWALVDTGINSSDSIQAFEAAVRAAGGTPSKIGKIICTHHHPDHFGASKALKELTGAQLLIHRAEHERTRIFNVLDRPPETAQYFYANGFPIDRYMNVPSPGEFWAGLFVAAAPDAFLEDGDIIRVGELELEVIWTPGHAPGHCVLHLRKEKLLFAGDHLLPKITPHVGYFPGGPEDPLGDFLDSQRKVQRWEVSMILPAHGGIFTDHRHRANQIIQHHDYRLREMLDFVRRAPHTAYEVAIHAFALDEDSPMMVRFPATFETLAHLEHLCQRGWAEKDLRNDRIYYRGRR